MRNTQGHPMNPRQDWLDSEGNVDWDAKASEANELAERECEVLGIATIATPDDNCYIYDPPSSWELANSTRVRQRYDRPDDHVC
jgi:hypothetical protein